MKFIEYLKSKNKVSPLAGPAKNGPTKDPMAGTYCNPGVVAEEDPARYDPDELNDDFRPDTAGLDLIEE